MIKFLCFIIFVYGIICDAKDHIPAFAKILKFYDSETYVEIDLPHKSTYNVGSSGINLSYKSFALYIHHSKRLKNSHSFFQVVQKEFYDYNHKVMHLKFNNIIEYNKSGWNGFKAELLSSTKSEKIALIYVFLTLMMFLLSLYLQKTGIGSRVNI